MKNIGAVKKTLIIFFAIFLLFEVIFLILPRIISPSSIKPQIQEIAKNRVGVDFDFENMKVLTYPDFSVKIIGENISIKTLADIKDLELKIWLPKFLVKKVAVKKFSANNSDFQIIKYKDGSTNIEKILKKVPFDIDLNHSDINICKFLVRAYDENIGQKINLDGKSFVAKVNRNDLDAKVDVEIKDGENLENNAQVNLEINMPMPDLKRGFRTKSKYLLATGYVKNLRPQIFKEYIKTYIDKDILDLTGVINADFKPIYDNKKLKAIDVDVLIDDLKLITKKPENSIFFNGENRINSKLIIDKNDLSIENFLFSGKDYKISLNGEIKNFKSQKPKVDLNATLDNTRLEPIYWMLPSNLFTKLQEVRKIKKYGAHGVANGNIQIKGNIMKPEVYGKVNIGDIWILDGLPNDVPKAIVDVDLRGDNVYVDVKVWATKNEYVTVKGYSNFYDLSDNQYQINSTENVPLAVAQKLLPPISDVLGFVIGPVPIMDIKGLGNIDLKTKGSQKNPDLRGYFNFKNASAAFNDIKVIKLENADGRIDFKGDKVYFKNTKGTILGQSAKISGVSDIKVNIDYLAEVNGVSLSKLLETLNTSPMLKDYAKQISMIDSADGIADVFMKIQGHFDDPKAIENPDVIKYINPNGTIKLRNANVRLKDPKTTILNTTGEVGFSKNETKLNLEGNIFSSKIDVTGKIIKNIANLNINSKEMKLIDSFKVIGSLFSKNAKNFNFSDISHTTTFGMKMNYKGSVEKIDLKKVDLKADFPNKTSSNSKIDVLSGDIKLQNENLKINNLTSKFYNTYAKFNGKVDKVFSNPLANIDMTIFGLDIGMLNSIKNSNEIPEKYRKILNAYKDYQGKLSAKLNIRNNNLNGNIWLRDISFVHSVLDYPFNIKSGDFKFLNNNLNINSFSASFAGTPIFMNGNVKNIVKNPDFDIYFTSKLSKDFVGNYINTMLSYPIELKGEILLSANISGTKDNINIYPSMRLEEGADISYMGAEFGDENSIREIKGHFKKLPQKLVVKNLDYSKYIYSQNNRLYPLPLVKITADINDDLYINYLNIKTQNPIDANIFNAIFKKSLIKKGKVDCDLKISGGINAPDILGTMNLSKIDIPSYETYIDDVSINFGPKFIDVKSNAKYFDSNIDIAAKINNKPYDTIHFDNIEVHSEYMNLNKFLDSLSEISYLRPIQIVGQQSKNTSQPLTQFDFNKLKIDNGQLKIDNGQLKIDKIEFKNLVITNFKAALHLNDSDLKIDDTTLDIAGGKLTGKFNYNFENGQIAVNTNVEGVDANEMSMGLLNIKNQIYGNVNGGTTLTTSGANDEERMNNLSGDLNFSIDSGRMPKLGSIEYLLRAGNLIKSGISGLTLNNLVGLLIPVQSGNFDEIHGELNINDGKIDDMKIYSKGQNLSILITGMYNLINSEANVDILGKLSKNVDTIFGPLGNASLNSLFNLIPGINIDEQNTELMKQLNSIPELGMKSKKYRFFRAIVDGDIYSDNFVSKFEWIGPKTVDKKD